MALTQKELTDLLNEASIAYYQNNGEESPLTDTEFDLKLAELQKMEQVSGIVYPHSPTQRVGSDALDHFEKIKHPVPMLTISNVYDDEGLKSWVEKMVSEYQANSFHFSVKYDGISCELHYKNGILSDASTRGDKNTGDDITANVKTIKNVPLKLTLASDILNLPEDFYVRGEILLPKSKLNALNEERIENGEVPFSNTRNACSGSIKQLDSRICAKRGLIFKPWDCYAVINGNAVIDGFALSMFTKVNLLKNLGFDIDWKETFLFVGNNSDNVIKQLNEFKSFIDSLNLDFDYDGVVVKLDSLKIQDEIGTKDTRSIEWGIARKWNEDYVVETKLLDIDWQVGKTGVLTPVGRLEPVECAGVIITNVTLNNIGFIRDLGIRIGDTLRITRSGGVIPYVLSVKETSEDSREILQPASCPDCGGEIVLEGALLKCTNPHCPSQVKAKILHFCSKAGMDIMTIGESVVDDLYRLRLVRSLYDMIHFEGSAVSVLVKALGEGYGEKKIWNMIDGIKNSRLGKPFETVLASLSIPGVGKVVGRILAKEFGDIYELMAASEERLSEIDGIGPIMAHNIVEWFSYEENKATISALEWWHYKLANEETEEISEQPLKNLTVCFTGKSNSFSGDAVEDYLESCGAKCTHSVSKSLNYLILGEKPGGSKVAKAESLGVEMINESDFYQKFGI